MRTFLILASVVALGASSASCGNSQDGSHSASDVLPAMSILAPSPLDASARDTTMAKGGNGRGSSRTSTFALVMVDDVDQNGLPNYGETVTFQLSTTVTSPFVSIHCYQGSSWVYAASVGYFDAYLWPKEFTLAANSWPDGAADCTARLYTTTDGTRTTTLATLSFYVYE